MEDQKRLSSRRAPYAGVIRIRFQGTVSISLKRDTPGGILKVAVLLIWSSTARRESCGHIRPSCGHERATARCRQV